RRQPRTPSTHAAPPQHSTLSLHDALPISTMVSVPTTLKAATTQIRNTTSPIASFSSLSAEKSERFCSCQSSARYGYPSWLSSCRSEEHTSELQSRGHLVCRLLLETKNIAW